MLMNPIVKINEKLAIEVPAEKTNKAAYSKTSEAKVKLLTSTASTNAVGKFSPSAAVLKGN